MTTSDQGGDMAPSLVTTDLSFPQPPSTVVHNRPSPQDQLRLTPVVMCRADTYEWAGTTYCKCPHCGGLDVSYVGDDLDICGTCHGKFVCAREVEHADS